MKNLKLILFLSLLLCYTTAYSEETKSNDEAASVSTEVTTTTEEKSTEAVKTDEKTSTEVKSSDEEANPFDDESTITPTAKAEATKIADVAVAEAAGITENSEGFPQNGILDALGGSTLRLRSWPWGNVIAQYSGGTSVEVLGESGEFYLVNINGTQGYMHKNFVTCGDKKASGIDPYYPGNTASGGALSLEEGVKASKDGAEGKVPSVSTPGATSGSSTPGELTVSGNAVDMTVPTQNQYQANVPAPGSACGPTSLSMILSYYGKGDTQSLVSDLWYVTGCTEADGTGHEGLANGAKKYGFPNAQWYYSVDQSWCRSQLQAGKPLLCHVAHHYVVMRGMDANGNVIVNDPAYNGVYRTMSWSEFATWWENSGLGKSCMTCE